MRHKIAVMISLSLTEFQDLFMISEFAEIICPSLPGVYYESKCS